MIYAIMSDAHANPAALEAAVVDARSRGCGRFVLLGDVTGYGYDVKSTLKLVRENFDVVLMGNHDSACLGLEPEYEVSSNHNYWVDVKQREVLSEEGRKWLRDRPYLHVEGDMAFVHDKQMYWDFKEKKWVLAKNLAQFLEMTDLQT